MKRNDVHPIRVSTYSGFKGEERPVAFDHCGKTLCVEEIIDRWIEGALAPEEGVKQCFRVKADDGLFYILSYDPKTEGWFLKRASTSSSQINGCDGPR